MCNTRSTTKVRRVLLALGLAATALTTPVRASDDNEIVIDLAPFSPLGVVGEIIGIGTEEGEVIGARLDVTYLSTDAGSWSVAINFEGFPMGGSLGLSSEAEGWVGAGTFSTSIETDALNGTLSTLPGLGFYSWIMTWAGGATDSLLGDEQAFGTFLELKLTLTLEPCDNCPPWSDLGGGTEGVAGVPFLTGSGPLLGGLDTTLCLDQVPPSALVVVFASLSSTPINVLGGTLHANPATVQRLFTTDPKGHLELSAPWPILPFDTDVWFQFAVQDRSAPPGLTLSNGVLAAGF
jgi:hypothetical protein